MKLLLKYSIPIRMGSKQEGRSPSPKTLPFPYHKGKGTKGIGSPDKILRE